MSQTGNYKKELKPPKKETEKLKTIIWIISMIAALVFSIMYMIYWFNNPELTYMQLLINKWWMPLASIGSALIGFIVVNLEKNN